MEEMGYEADLVRDVENLMEERKVIMPMDGEEEDSQNVETGVPQGLPVLLVLLVIYLTELLSQVEKQEESCESEGISFVDDVAWVLDGGGCGGMYTEIGKMC